MLRAEHEIYFITLEPGSPLYAKANITIIKARRCTVLFPCNVNLGPVVRSIISLTSSLRGQLFRCFTTL